MSSPKAPILQAISDTVCRVIRDAEIFLPQDVKERLNTAAINEQNPVARRELDNILTNIRLAEERTAPICQDTGIPVLYITLPREIPISQDIRDAIEEGVKQATITIPLRPNVVDPLTRHNTSTNTGLSMPPVHFSTGDTFTITALPKGAGSENVSRIRMFTPAEKDQIDQFIVETVLIAGSRPCPPVILGVGIGGTFDICAALAKEALLEPITSMTVHEEDLCKAINKLGIGPMGLGGDTTCLGVKIKTAGCHTASLPVAVNIQCWAARRATAEVQW